jgi:hypothetical protein
LFHRKAAPIEGADAGAVTCSLNDPAVQNFFAGKSSFLKSPPRILQHTAAVFDRLWMVVFRPYAHVANPVRG